MLLYNELGRHTPPPPPYSLSRRDSSRSKAASEGSQRPAPLPPPPPPPPYLSSSAAKPDCTIPSADNLRRRSVGWDISYLCRDDNAILLPPVSLQRSGVQVSTPQQSFEDYPGSLMSDWNRPSLPAQPVEPRWTPVGVLGYPGPPLGGTRTPLPMFQSEKWGHSTHPSFEFGAGTGIVPAHEKLTSRLPNGLYLGHSVAPCATQPAIHSLDTVAMIGQKPLHILKRQPSKDITSLRNIVTNDATGSVEAFDTMCSWSWAVAPSQQAIERRATLVMPPTAQELGAVEKLLSLKNLLDASDVNTRSGNRSDGEQAPVCAAMGAKHPGYTFPALPKQESWPSNHYTSSRGRNKGSYGVHSSHRRSSASARFAPYKRRQSTMAERMGRRLGSAVDSGCGESLEMQSDFGMKEDKEMKGSSRGSVKVKIK